MEPLYLFAAGIMTGVLITILIIRLRQKDTDALLKGLIIQNEYEKNRNLEFFMNAVKDSFGELSYRALVRNSGEFLKIANEMLQKQTQSGERDLDEKKYLIDHTLHAMRDDLNKVQDMVHTFEKDREKKFGELAQQLKTATEETARLQDVTFKLQHALSNTKIRGQWGERMAEDVLRIAGFIEGINYVKQKRLNSGNSRPDFTFLLPQHLRINMDVKFPLDNYLRVLEAQNDLERDKRKNQFLKDARNRIREVTTREYINPEDHTVDYVIVFIPNERVYTFLCEEDASFINEALRQKVILSSPITLYAILAVIRQATENFNLEQKASDIMIILKSFKKQWNLFVSSFDKLGRKIEETQTEYRTLTTTRRHKLERQLQRMEEVRSQHRDAEVPAPCENIFEDKVDEPNIPE